MRMKLPRRVHACAVVTALVVFANGRADSAEGVWKFEIDDRDHPILTYLEDGKAVFLMACGRAFGLHARYPGTPKKKGKATITLTSATAKMTFAGEFQEPWGGGATTFLQWDLGYRRQDPALYGKAWNAEKRRLLDLLGAGPITVSAEGRKYEIPAAAIPDWKAAFEKCGE